MNKRMLWIALLTAGLIIAGVQPIIAQANLECQPSFAIGTAVPLNLPGGDADLDGDGRICYKVTPGHTIYMDDR